MLGTPRFLITTADERSWHTDRPVLFLGEWCRQRARRPAWESIDAVVVPDYGWGEGQQDADYAYSLRLYEQLLVELSESLNQFHGTAHSLRYWRILLGPWLHIFTAIVINRWATIELALRDFDITGTVVLEFLAEQITPSSFDDFSDMYYSHSWNHAIMGRILNGWTKVPCDRIVAPKSECGLPEKASSPPLALRRRLRRAVERGLRPIFQTLSRPTDALLVATTLTLKHDVLLQLALGQIPNCFWQTPLVPRIAPDVRARAQLSLGSANHLGFEQCIRTLIAEQIPTLYLEGYQTLQMAATELPWPKRPKVIFTSINHTADDVFKIWAAEKAEQGIPYVIGQHGGNYGTAKHNSYNQVNEVATADRYLTWGWSEGNSKHYPSAALKIVGKPSGTWDPDGGLLQVTWLESGYSRMPWSHTNFRVDYLEDQFRFASALPRAIRTALTVRLQFGGLRYGGEPHDVQWRARDPDIRIDPGSSPIEPMIRRSRLSIFTYNSTGFLETMGRNIPTIVFWDPKYSEVRPSAQFYFDLLRKVGLLHESPESAAAKVAEVWDEVATWWSQPGVQEARRVFCDRFARVPVNPVGALKHALTTVGS
ncbi:MAG: LIC12162 family protein [Sulfuritalea sp.]|nr:LIC12162 family protein [Sulfuritalea sp.]